MTVTAELGSMVIFLVTMTGEAGLSGGNRPNMGGMACRTIHLSVLPLVVFPGQFLVARLAVSKRFDLLLLKMARTASHGHHRSRRVDLMTGDTVEGRSVSCAVALVTEDLGMLSFQWPGMPGLHAARAGGSQRKERAALGHRVADRTGTGKHLASRVCVPVIVAPETPGPVAMADVIWISRPVYIHGREDIPIVYFKDRIDRPLELLFLALDDLWIVLRVVVLDG